MKIVLDSNILLVAVGKRSKFRPIWQAFLNGDFQIIISSDILFEYEEVLSRHSAPGAAGLVTEILSVSPSVIFKRIYYQWNAIKSDADDNKFFDVAVAGGADMIVTNDKHFDEARTLRFPKMKIVDADAFLEILRTIT